MSGNHWSCAHINLDTGDGLYADSMGREVPRTFEDKFCNFFQAIYKVYEKKYDFIKSMQVAHEIQSTKSAHKCGYFCVKNFIKQRNDISICGIVAVFSAITMSEYRNYWKTKNDPLPRLDEWPGTI